MASPCLRAACWCSPPRVPAASAGAAEAPGSRAPRAAGHVARAVPGRCFVRVHRRGSALSVATVGHGRWSRLCLSHIRGCPLAQRQQQQQQQKLEEDRRRAQAEQEKQVCLLVREPSRSPSAVKHTLRQCLFCAPVDCDALPLYDSVVLMPAAVCAQRQARLEEQRRQQLVEQERQVSARRPPMLRAQ